MPTKLIWSRTTGVQGVVTEISNSHGAIISLNCLAPQEAGFGSRRIVRPVSLSTSVLTTIAKFSVGDSRCARNGRVRHLLVSTAVVAIIAAMAAHPILIERPIVATEKGVVIARPPERVHEVL